MDSTLSENTEERGKVPWIFQNSFHVDRPYVHMLHPTFFRLVHARAGARH
jgi:hypothetical protein